MARDTYEQYLENGANRTDNWELVKEVAKIEKAKLSPPQT